MGVISITQRSERLGNLGSTGMAHGVTSTDIGTVHHTRPADSRTFRRTPAVDYGALGDVIGDGILDAVRIHAAVQLREDERKSDDYANAMMDSMEKMSRDESLVDDWNTPERRHLKDQRRGFYLRTGEGTKNVVEEWQDAFGDTFKKIGDSIEANDRVRELTMKKLMNYRRSTVSRLSDHAANEYRRTELDSAGGTLERLIDMWKGGRTETLADVFGQQERVDALKRSTPEMRLANRGKLALRLASDFVENSIGQCRDEKAFDQVEESVKNGLKEALPDMIADNLPGDSRTVDGEYRESMMKRVKQAKRLFVAERDAEEREAREAVGRDFTARELKMRDVPKELWADAYEAMGRDEKLRAADPKRAMSYMDAAAEMRDAAKRAKEKAAARASKDAVKNNEEMLSRSLATLDVLKMEGTLDQDEADKAQADVWRKFRTLSVSGGISPAFMNSFRSRLSGELTDQEANAMRKFYRAFGFSPYIDSSGEPTASQRKTAEKDSTDYYAPWVKRGVERRDDTTRVKAADLISYGDALLKTLRSLGPDMNREGVVDREIARLKTGWIKRDLDANREATLRSVMDMQRETRTMRNIGKTDERSEENDDYER